MWPNKDFNFPLYVGNVVVSILQFLNGTLVLEQKFKNNATLSICTTGMHVFLIKSLL